MIDLYQHTSFQDKDRNTIIEFHIEKWKNVEQETCMYG